MRGSKIISILLLCALIMSVFLYYQPKVQATVDFILIVQIPGTGQNETPDMTVDTGFTMWGYAASFNLTSGYIDDVNATWTVINNGSTASTNPSSGEGSEFNAGLNPGIATWRAEFGAYSDTVEFTIDPSGATTDYIQIRSAPNGFGVDLGDPANCPSYPLGQDDYFYGAAYNYTMGFIGNVPTSSTWISDNTSVVSVTSPGYSTYVQCSPSNEGWAIITLDDGMGNSNTTNVSVVTAEIDYITIMDSSDGNGSFIWLEYYDLSEIDTFWAAGFNSTYGFIQDVSVNWSSSDPGIGTVTTPGTSTTFTAAGYGRCNVTADYGGGITNMTGPLIVVSVDYIQIQDSHNEEVGMDFIYNWGGAKKWYYAAGYNFTYGYYKDVDVTWENSNTSVGTVSPSGTYTIFTAGADGTCFISANYSGIIDETGMITVSSYDVDYINVRDAPFGGGNVIVDPSYPKGATDIFYGAMYSYTAGYLSDTPYNTPWNSTYPHIVSVTTPGNYTTITCDDVNFGTTNIHLWHGNLSNYTTVTVEEWTIDYIKINDAPGGGGNEVSDITYSVWDVDTFYVAAYNNTHGFVMDVTGDWSSSDDTVGTVTTPGISTTFTAQWVTSDSTCQVDVLWDVFSDSTGILTVLTPTADYIQIHDTPDGGGHVITSISYYTGETDTYYGVEINVTVGYLRAVQSSATWTSTDDTIVEVTSPGSSSTITCSDTNPGSVTITLDDGVFSNTTEVDVLSYTVDYILIRDEPSGGGNDLTDPANYPTFPVGATDTFYGALYNDSQGYLGDVSSLASWISSDSDIVTSSSPGSSSLLTCSETNYGTVDITLEEWTGHSASTQVTVQEPTIDYMTIRDAADGAGEIVGDMEYDIFDTDAFHAAAYNNTAGYLYDISVDWSSDDTDVGTVTTPGSQTTFTAEGEGTCIVTGDYGGGISDTTGTLTVTIPLNLTVDDSGGAMFTTISDALDYAQNGSNIFVYSGTYYENFTIDLSISIIGENMNATIIDGDDADKIINVVADNVTIKELTVQDGEYNIYCDETDSTDIRYCIIKDYDYGIYDYKTTDAYVAYNTITTGEYGIVTYEADNDAIRWNTISYNTEYGAKDYNSELKNCFNWNYFHHNNIAYYYDPDVNLSVMEFDGNIFEDNEIAIKVENASTISITNNTLTRNDYGILLIKASPDISDNTISIADYGIYSEDSSPSISNNLIGEISEYAIYAKTAESIRILDNTITDSGVIFIDSNIQELRAEDTLITNINTSVQDVQLDENSNLETKWEMQLRIVDKNGESIEDAAVLIYNTFDDLVSAQISDSEGWIEVVEVIDTMQSGSTVTSHNPYRVVILKDSIEETFEVTVGEETIRDITFEGKAEIIQPSGPSFFWIFIFLVGFVVVVGAGALAIEMLKFGLLSLFLPLYTRLKKEKLLDQPTRERIYGYIIGNPGAYFGLIREELDLGNGQLVYHLKQLEDAHLIYSREDGAKKRFYPADVPIIRDGATNISSIQEKILVVIKGDSGIGQKKIASKMGISRQVAGYHLTKMERKGLINKEVIGRETKYYPS